MRIWKAFITLRDEPGGPAAFFNQLSEFTQIFGTAICLGQTLVGDGAMVTTVFFPSSSLSLTRNRCCAAISFVTDGSL